MVLSMREGRRPALTAKRAQGVRDTRVWASVVLAERASQRPLEGQNTRLAVTDDRARRIPGSRWLIWRIKAAISGEFRKSVYALLCGAGFARRNAELPVPDFSQIAILLTNYTVADIATFFRHDYEPSLLLSPQAQDSPTIHGLHASTPWHGSCDSVTQGAWGRFAAFNVCVREMTPLLIH